MFGSGPSHDVAEHWSQQSHTSPRGEVDAGSAMQWCIVNTR
jgi:hypothetical protein